MAFIDFFEMLALFSGDNDNLLIIMAVLPLIDALQTKAKNKHNYCLHLAFKHIKWIIFP